MPAESAESLPSSHSHPGRLPAPHPPPQALKYAFQTHDRLCFVMEYANGGEVSVARVSVPTSPSQVSWEAEGSRRGGRGGLAGWPLVLEAGVTISISQARKLKLRSGGLAQVHTASESVGRGHAQAQRGLERLREGGRPNGRGRP